MFEVQSDYFWETCRGGNDIVISPLDVFLKQKRSQDAARILSATFFHNSLFTTLSTLAKVCHSGAGSVGLKLALCLISFAYSYARSKLRSVDSEVWWVGSKDKIFFSGFPVEKKLCKIS